MKRLLPLLLSCFLLFEGYAQNDYVQKFNYNALDRLKTYRYKKPSVAMKDSNIVLYNLNLLKEKKPGVYALRQDNMPCIVPDSTKTARIPNAWKAPQGIPYQKNPLRIPNLDRPWVPTPIANENSNTK